MSSIKTTLARSRYLVHFKSAIDPPVLCATYCCAYMIRAFEPRETDAPCQRLRSCMHAYIRIVYVATTCLRFDLTLQS